MTEAYLTWCVTKFPAHPDATKRDEQPHREVPACVSSRLICFRSSRHAAQCPICANVHSSSNLSLDNKSAVNTERPGQPVRSGFGWAVWIHRSKAAMSSGSPGSTSIGRSVPSGPALNFSQFIFRRARPSFRSRDSCRSVWTAPHGRPARMSFWR
jgi:hypothetical protein